MFKIISANNKIYIFNINNHNIKYIKHLIVAITRFFIVLFTILSSFLVSSCTSLKFDKSIVEDRLRQNIREYGRFGDTQLQFLSSSEIKDKNLEKYQSRHIKLKNYGAFYFERAEEEATESKKPASIISTHNDKRLFSVNRFDKAYLIETKFLRFNNSDTFLGVGFDNSDKKPAITLRLEF